MEPATPKGAKVSEVIVTAVFKAKQGHEDVVVGALKEAAAQTHAEEGCILYALHQGAEDPCQIVLVERWRAREDLDEHLTKPYIQALGEQVELLAEPPQVFFLDALPAGDESKGRL